MSETYMAGSERFVCQNCKHEFYKNEGTKYGFKFKLD